jgi:peptidoglycan DL-endopeptidase CwlO
MNSARKYLLAAGIFVLAIGSLRFWSPFESRYDLANVPRCANCFESLTKSCPFVTAGGSKHIVAQTVREAGARFGLPDELLYAMIFVESRCNADARSERGATGLMQVMPATAREVGYDATSLRGNIFAGAKYLSQMKERFGDLDLALAAYNAGPSRVQRHAGIPPLSETQNYVKKVRIVFDRLSTKRA